MSTWEEMRVECQRAGQSLKSQEHWRSSVSRSYYAAYCGVTGVLVQRGVTFPQGWGNPRHADLQRYITNCLLHVSEGKRHQVRRGVEVLWKARLDADYHPGVSFCERDARDALRVLHSVLRQLEVT